MNKPLKQAVNDKLDTFELSDQRLRQLESLQVRAPAAKKPGVRFLGFVAAGAAAAFLLTIILTPLLVEHGDVRERIAMEVAKNHIKLKPMEVETASIEGIREYFEKLDFLPVSSALVERAGLELVGGRYCSLQGVTAAQLRVRKPGSEKLQTLYQTEYIEDVFQDMPLIEQGDEPVELYVKGVRVKIWVEKGLLFALTERPENANQ